MFLHSFIPKSEQKIPLKTETITEQSLRIFGTSHAYPFNNRPRFHASATGSDFYFRRSLDCVVQVIFFHLFRQSKSLMKLNGHFLYYLDFFRFVMRKRRFSEKISSTFQLAYTEWYLNNLITASQTFYRRLRNFHHWKMLCGMSEKLLWQVHALSRIAHIAKICVWEGGRYYWSRPCTQMSRLSPNLDKLKALHHLKRDAGLAQLISIVANDTDLDLALPVQVNHCLKSGFIPSESRSLQQKAEEFCRKTRVIANKCKVFVGNVSYRVKSRELKEFFGYFGKVIHAEIITNRMNKRSRG